MQKCLGGAGEVTQWVKVLAGELGILSLIPRTHLVEGKS